jgi:hypothetical protein
MIKHYIALLIISIFMIGALVYGFLNGGSPWEARSKKFDQTRVANIKDIKYAIESYYMKNKSLPQDLSEIKESLYGQKNITDPETDVPYEYKIVDNYSYQLCASFSSDPPAKNSYNYLTINSTDLGEYKKGHHCFDITISGYNSVNSNNAYSASVNNFSSSINQATSESEIASSCKTLDTKLVVGSDGKGTIGCDVEVKGEIDLEKSFCRGIRSRRYTYLKVDELKRPNRYYATLVQVDPTEEVEVSVVDATSGNFIPCTPNLNKQNP